MTNQQLLAAYPEINDFTPPSNPLCWSGRLTLAQAKISARLCQVWQHHQEHLVWAVTGSGKTEMLFPMLAQAIMHGDRIALAAPRIDVCQELFPRLQAAFPQVTCSLLYGRSEVSYRYTQILICTVHQLLKFRAAFDLLILDECDSFPYLNNPMLHQAVQQAVKTEHTVVYLSATPSQEYQTRIKQGHLTHSLLNRRFHGHDLPVPSYQLVARTSSVVHLAIPLIRQIKFFLQRQQRFLLFVDSVTGAQKLSQTLKKQLPELEQTFVHAQDPQRLEKVERFRAGTGQALVTTTILERGVTFDHIAVLVWAADSQRFSSQTLIQIAGRAGRSAAHSFDPVIFYGANYTLAIAKAIATIRRLNRES
ncbi:DEAD/DEAH box helicase family protein [Lactobacillus sp. DCY120]|uniref:DEAD/DEAH box helicase family protein n=1 Tax=Bombilactobacillus apium TaxID=2675299 RepID=A0A850QYB2_9LACO|nr:DEAD/DEAH box helicase family protein [Bombilactobacillus apium]NVY96824.1 DEAD/DEAH box helicase family protein [Bombilactobacillus apium]